MSPSRGRISLLRHDRLIRPGRRKQRVSTKPSHAGAAHPFSEYMVLPSDSQGRSASISFGAPPAFQRLAATIRDRGTMPFELSSDVFRWAVFFGLEELARRSENKEITGEFSSIQSMVATAAKEAEALAYEKKLSEIIRTIRRLAEAGHTSKAEDLASFAWINADKIEDPYWRRQYRTKAKHMLDKIKSGGIEQQRRDDDGDDERRGQRIKFVKKQKQKQQKSDNEAED